MGCFADCGKKAALIPTVLISADMKFYPSGELVKNISYSTPDVPN
jgi:hypothetical protein